MAITSLGDRGLVGWAFTPSVESQWFTE